MAVSDSRQMWGFREIFASSVRFWQVWLSSIGTLIASCSFVKPFAIGKASKDDRHGGLPSGYGYMRPSEDREQESRNREFVRLLAKHDLRLAEYIHTLVPLWHDAEDIIQNTKLRLWEQFDSFRPGTDFAAWAFTIAGYLVRAHRKCCQRRRICFSDDLLEKLSQEVPVVSSLAEDRVSALVECVKMLSDSSRKLLALFCMGHRKVKDIASDLGQAPSATYQALSRTRRQLFECVEKRLQEKIS